MSNIEQLRIKVINSTEPWAVKARLLIKELNGVDLTESDKRDEVPARLSREVK